MNTTLQARRGTEEARDMAHRRSSSAPNRWGEEPRRRAGAIGLPLARLPPPSLLGLALWQAVLGVGSHKTRSTIKLNRKAGARTESDALCCAPACLATAFAAMWGQGRGDEVSDTAVVGDLIQAGVWRGRVALVASWGCYFTVGPAADNTSSHTKHILHTAAKAYWHRLKRQHQYRQVCQRFPQIISICMLRFSHKWALSSKCTFTNKRKLT
jgi:hypothetical protein